MRKLWMIALLLAAGCQESTGPGSQPLTDVSQLAGDWRMSAWEFTGEEHPEWHRDLIAEGVRVTLRIAADGSFDATITYQGQRDHGTGTITLLSGHRLTLGPTYRYTYSGSRLVLVGTGTEQIDLNADGDTEDATERVTLDRI